MLHLSRRHATPPARDGLAFSRLSEIMRPVLRWSPVLLFALAVGPRGYAQAPAHAPTGHVLSYRVLEREDISVANLRRKTIRIMLPIQTLPADADVRATAYQIWSDGNRSWDSYTVWTYLPGMETQGAAYATTEFTPAGLKSFRVSSAGLYGTTWWARWTARHPGPKPARGPRIAYRFAGQVTLHGPDSLAIALTTDLPDGTRVLVDVTREYWERGRSQTDAGDIFSRDVPVQHGQLALTVVVDDASWLKDYSDQRRRFEGTGMFTGIARISPRVEVSLMMSPMRDQPASVLAVIGANGEHLGGPAAKLGFLTVLEYATHVAIPVRR